MLKIAVCDDNAADRTKLRESIEQFTEAEICIAEFSDGGELLYSDICFDLIFLDIEMEKTNGIETAVKLREINPHVAIVYVTYYSAHWREAYKVHAFDYVIKPFEVNEIHRILDDIIGLKKREKTLKVIFDTDSENIVLNPDDILYFIFIKRNTVKLITNSGEIIVKESFADVLNKLSSSGFYAVHRDTAVNLFYVKQIDANTKDKVIMTDNRSLPLARRKYKDFYFTLSKNLRKTER